MTDPTFPHIITGTVSSSSNPVGSRVVRITNKTTGETITATTNSRGKYVADAANFASGYTNGDTIEIQMDNDFPYYDNNIKVSGGKIEFR